MKGNRRYRFTPESKRVVKTREFFDKLFLSFANEKFWHYKIPRTGTGITRSIAGNRTVLPIDINDSSTMSIRTLKTNVRSEEETQLELIAVRFLANQNWEEILKVQFDTFLLTRKWNFPDKLTPDTLHRFQENFPRYVGKDIPERRQDLAAEMKLRKRKR